MPLVGLTRFIIFIFVIYPTTWFRALKGPLTILLEPRSTKPQTRQFLSRQIFAGLCDFLSGQDLADDDISAQKRKFLPSTADFSCARFYSVFDQFQLFLRSSLIFIVKSGESTWFSRPIRPNSAQCQIFVWTGPMLLSLQRQFLSGRDLGY
jgi:hypothetical protein